MSLLLYMDAQVPLEITKRLRAVGVDVLTAQEDGTDALPDEELLERVQALGRVLFTQDEGFLTIAAHLQRKGETFWGIFFGRHAPARNKLYAEWLEAYAKLSPPEELRDRLVYLR
ncbi:MAG TPA: DUF5615 family PIN-like protein [Phycisphaerae bacterium]|nr:DUF5615 family PIN-like protein [Phycisphaerae bacterium]